MQHNEIKCEICGHHSTPDMVPNGVCFPCRARSHRDVIDQSTDSPRWSHLLDAYKWEVGGFLIALLFLGAMQ